MASSFFDAYAILRADNSGAAAAAVCTHERAEDEWTWCNLGGYRRKKENDIFVFVVLPLFMEV